MADLSGLRFVEVVLVDLQAYVWTAQWSTWVLRLDDGQNAALVEGIMPGAVRLEVADSQNRPSRRGVRWAVSVDAYRFDEGRRWLGGWWRQRVLRREDDPLRAVVGFAGPGNGWGLRAATAPYHSVFCMRPGDDVEARLAASLSTPDTPRLAQVLGGGDVFVAIGYAFGQGESDFALAISAVDLKPELAGLTGQAVWVGVEQLRRQTDLTTKIQHSAHQSMEARRNGQDAEARHHTERALKFADELGGSALTDMVESRIKLGR